MMMRRGYRSQTTGFTSLRRPGLQAFTLIELLVVIVIIMILAAFIFPVFASARAKARQATCQSNLRQIGLAIALYKTDYDEIYVPKYDCIQWDTVYKDHCDSPTPDPANPVIPIVPGNPSATVVTWLARSDAPPGTDYLLMPYLKNDAVRFCPSRYIGATEQGRYVLNAWDSSFGNGAGQTSPQGQPDSKVTDPSGTLLVWEHENQSPECQIGQQGAVGNQLAPESPPGSHWETGHSGGMDTLWCDGHVRWMTTSQLQVPMFIIQR